MSTRIPLHLFEGFGVELEYMVVDGRTLDVKPVVDELLRAVAGSYVGDWENGAAAWSNELVNHVIEFKTNGPAKSLTGLAALFDTQAHEANQILSNLGARLMPSGAHPWMDPFKETRLWTHDEFNEVYEAFNRIFDCRGHGWSNLQSMHINLPFHGDEEFARLHAAIRLVLPIMPAVAASTPVLDGRLTGLMDNRLEVYRLNSRKIPSICGRVIPEPVYTKAAYEGELLQRIYDDLAPHDSQGILRYEFVNARGAIARFDRDAIEIRVLDVQETPAADLAVASLVIGAVRALVEERTATTAAQKAWSIERLEPMLLACIREGGKAHITDADYLALWRYPAGRPCTAKDLWRHIGAFAEHADKSVEQAQAHILRNGCLASRIVDALGGPGVVPSRPDLARVYGELCECLANRRMFGAAE